MGADIAILAFGTFCLAALIIGWAILSK